MLGGKVKRKKQDLTNARKQIVKKYMQSHNDRVRCEQAIEETFNENQNEVSTEGGVDDMDSSVVADNETNIGPIVAGGELSATDMGTDKPTQRGKRKCAREKIIGGKKAADIITPSWLQIHRPMDGYSLRKSPFIPYKPNVTYEYWDDPNELCERLKILMSSQNAGNTNHAQEIDSIIEELNERGLIS